MLELLNISKKFGSLSVLNSVSFRVEKGEIHGLLGENGAGKTTLMNVAGGFLRADQGHVRVGGEEFPPGVHLECARGIGMVHQQFLLVPSLTVAENLSLGIHGKGITYNKKRAEDEIRALSEKYQMPLDPGARVSTLPVAIQQRVEILKAMKGRPRVLILDEPTAVLTPQESDQLILSMKGLAGAGMAIVFISHKHREILEACGRVSVLRKGEMVGTLDVKAVTSGILAELMMGEPPSRDGAKSAKVEQKAGHQDGTGIEIQDLWVDSDSGGTGLRGISLEVHPGMITAVVGIEGNGQLDLEEVLGGLRIPRLGSVFLNGLNPAKARRLGGVLGFVPSDRDGTGLILDLDLNENLALAPEGRLAGRLGFIDRKSQSLRSVDLMAHYDVRSSGLHSLAGTLSGGNKQKLVLARELSPEPPIVVACHPTRGLDMGATSAVLERLVEARRRGASVLLITAEIDEALELADQVYVIWRGLLRQASPGVDRRAIGRLMLGEEA